MDGAHARAILTRFASRTPGCVVGAHPYALQGTNSWVFQGRLRGRPAMFKVSRRHTAAREAAALDRLAATGLVPRVLAVWDNVLLVTEFVQGATWRELCRRGLGNDPTMVASVAQATVRLISAASAAGPFDATLLRRNLDTTLDAARLLLQRHPGLYGADVFGRTLETATRARAALLADRPCRHFDDIGGANVLIHNGQFHRFIDMETYWQGTLHLQLGAMLANLTGPAYANLPLDAPRVVAVLASVFLRALPVRWDLLRAAALLKNWIRLLSPDGWTAWGPATTPRLLEGAPGGRARAQEFAGRLARTELLFR